MSVAESGALIHFRWNCGSASSFLLFQDLLVFETLLCGAHLFGVILSSWWVDPFFIMYCLLSLVNSCSEVYFDINRAALMFLG